MATKTTTAKAESFRAMVEAGSVQLEAGGAEGVPVGAGWLRTTRPSLLVRAESCARGCYQLAILEGDEALSGSTLIGWAADWKAGYRRSRENLFGRLEAVGIEAAEMKHGRRRVLLIGPCSDSVELW